MMMDLLIFIAFCVFMLLVGMRIKQRFGKRNGGESQERILKNQRPKMAEENEPPLVREKRLRREKRTRFFTIAQLFVLFGLLVFMTPALVKDLMLPGAINPPNFILRCFIFLFTIYIFILGYLKVFGKKTKEKRE